MGLRYIINGTTPFSCMIRRIVEAEGNEVLCFTTLSKFIDSSEIDGLPIIPTEKISESFDTRHCPVLNTVGYSKMNTIREKSQCELDSFNLNTVSYISSKANVYTDAIGRGCIVLPSAFIGPGVIMGGGNIIYSNVSLTHHIRIGNYNFLASGVICGGGVCIHNNCFVGLNSTIRNRLDISSYTLVGCASNVVKSINEENTIWMGNPARKVENRSAMDSIIV